jgi:hypothetical protein
MWRLLLSVLINRGLLPVVRGRGLNVLRILILFVFLLPIAANAADIYIDPDWSGTESGTFAEPYDSWADVTFVAGNSYRQKCGSTFAGVIDVDVTGTVVNPIVLSAYYDDGGAVHEEDSPNFGQVCGNAAAKPIINATGQNASAITIGVGVDYVTIHSLSPRNAVYAGGSQYDGVKIRNNQNNSILYCYIYNNAYGVRSYGSNATIKFNQIDNNDATDEDGQGVDGVMITKDNCVVSYNWVTGYDHQGIFMIAEGAYTASYTLVEHNYVFGDGNGHEDAGISTNYDTTANVIRWNYIKNTANGIQIQGGTNHKVYGNVIDRRQSVNPSTNSGGIQVRGLADSPITGGYFGRNTIFSMDSDPSLNGIRIYTNAGNAVIENNTFEYNVIQEVADDCISIVDNGGVVGTNYFTGNICYEYDGTYARIDASYENLATFNAHAWATGNLDADPGMTDPDNFDYTASSGSSNMVDAGGDQSGEDWDTGLLTANWTTMAFTYALGSENTNADAGAFEFGDEYVIEPILYPAVQKSSYGPDIQKSDYGAGVQR